MPWDQWRHDLNDKFDRLGEDKMSKLRGNRSQNSSYEERIASFRSGGGASGTVGGAPRPRMVPPPPPGGSKPAGYAAAAPVAAAAAPEEDVPPYEPPASTHIEFSRFTEEDKQAFFAMLDEYFAKRTDTSDMWLDDPFDAKSLLPVGHGLCSLVHKAPLVVQSDIVERHGGVPGFLCLKQVDVDEQNPPHNVQHELDLMKRLRHENLSALLAAFTETPDSFTTVYYLAMPLYPVLLSAILDDERFHPGLAPFPAADQQDEAWPALLQGRTHAGFVLQSMRELLSAVAYLHAEKVAHRDLKPANVMLGADGRVRLIDLGVAWSSGMHEAAQFANEHKTDLQLARISEVGTGAYRAPELLFAPQHGYNALQSDMWSLGVLISSFFTRLEQVPSADYDDEEDWSESHTGFKPWEQALWPKPPLHTPGTLRRAARNVTRRATLFDASRGDIGYAGDVFSVLGLPSDVAAWPEAAHFQPPLHQFPFVPHAGTKDLLGRLPELAELARVPSDEAAALHAFSVEWLPRLVQLSARERPTAQTLLDALC